MENVICDICGFEYEESLSQCPICGCAKKDASAESVESSYVKGGRFSKSNVRRRMKPETAGAASESVREYVKNNDERKVQRQPEKEEPEEDEQEPRSNRPLLLVVILLLLAIIAVSLYIVIAFSDPADSGDNTTTNSTTISVISNDGPCTSVQFSASEVKLDKMNPSKKLTVIVEPIKTKDTLSFESSDPSIIDVDKQEGNLTAYKKGSVTITVRCGSQTATITVVSDYEVPTTVTTTQPTTQSTTKPTLPQNSQFIIPNGAVAVASYRIRITYTGGAVNIRKGPGTSYDMVTDKAYINDEYTVIATFDDPKREYDWALTEKGWITLEYAQRIS